MSHRLESTSNCYGKYGVNDRFCSINGIPPTIMFHVPTIFEIEDAALGLAGNAYSAHGKSRQKSRSAEKAFSKRLGNIKSRITRAVRAHEAAHDAFTKAETEESKAHRLNGDYIAGISETTLTISGVSVRPAVPTSQNLRRLRSRVIESDAPLKQYHLSKHK